ncbi:hypothetical protein ACFVMC_00150 [Nocardia sp. NPDC127579]|uniref:hypothetical protein n=1 Tax=Nocardia sp. NPDC127579 TaxID=3345402 RepID=UPI003636FB23
MTTSTVVTCGYPRCVELAARTGKRGRPSQYCDNPGHTAVTAWRERQKITAKDAKAAARQPAPVERPVSEATDTLAGLVRRLEELRGEMVATFDDAGDLLATITDPRAVTDEIAQVRRECDRLVSDAEAAREGAERAADRYRAERDQAHADRALADGAAEHAVAERDQSVADAVESIRRARKQVAEAVAERDQVREEADRELDQMREQLAQARAAQARAETERDTAAAAAATASSEAAQLRSALDESRQAHQERVELLHTKHLDSLSEAHAAADQAARAMSGEHAKAMAALRDDGMRERNELRRDLETVRDHLEKVRRSARRRAPEADI